MYRLLLPSKESGKTWAAVVCVTKPTNASKNDYQMREREERSTKVKEDQNWLSKLNRKKTTIFKGLHLVPKFTSYNLRFSFRLHTFYISKKF